MKKFFLIAAAAAMVLSSCSKNNVSEDTSEANAINFGVYTGRSTTKAGSSFVPSTSTALPLGKSFGVYCYLATKNYANTSDFTANYMDNLPVQYKTEGATIPANYDYGTYKYWPKVDGVYLSFYGYYPSETGSNITPGSVTGKSLPKFDFTVKNAVSDQVDFMLADVVPDMVYTTANQGVVPMVFHHTLTQVNVKARVDAVVSGVEVKITNITFGTIKNSGTVTPDYNASATPKTSFSWTTIGTTTDSYSLTGSATALTETLAAIGVNDHTMLMIPQTFDATNDGTITITYTVTSTNGTTITKTSEPIHLKDVTNGNVWDINKQVTYNITVGIFSEHPIKFTASVLPWVDADPQPGTIKF
jgi:hypothetical protein